MSKITSKYQVTVPKKIAEAYGIRPGDEIEWGRGRREHQHRLALAGGPARGFGNEAADVR